MHLEQPGQYNLGNVATTDDICQAYSISRNHVNKIVHQLGKEGFIKTQRGKRGCFGLAMAAADINVGCVVQQLENNLQVIDCASPSCSILPACRLKGVLNNAATAFVEVLNRVNLKDLIQSKENQLISIFTVASVKPLVLLHSSALNMRPWGSAG